MNPGAGTAAPRTEFGAIARHAGTVLAGQLAVMAFGVTDTLVAGRHSEGALAALSVGSAIFVSVYVALMGVVQALLPVWAEQHGARRFAEIGASVRQALYVCIATAVLGMALLLSPGPLLRWAEVPEALRGDVAAYLRVLAAALPPALLFRLYGTLNQSLGKPQLVTWLQVGALGLKVPLTVWFALGGAGLPAQGAVGCAWATLAVNLLLCLVGVRLVRDGAAYAPYRIWRPLERPDPAVLRAFARLGIPAGLSILVEVTSFTLMALFVARQGTTASAAHQVAANVAAVLYMVPLSLAIATSARTSRWLGAGDAARARAAVGTGLRMAAATAALLAGAVFLGRGAIAGAYSANPATAATAAGLLAWVAAYHLADTVQCVSVFVLRCYRITVSALLVYGAMLWGAGLGGGYLVAYRGLGPFGPLPEPATFWKSSALALAVTAAVLLALVRRAVRRPAAG
ncbi:MAG: MATE family efflux transporter [Xylophilus ampelinus]